MTQENITILEELELPQGMEIDLDEGWRKLISRQTAGDAGRGFRELIQNFLDSYPADTPWQERRGEIRTGKWTISITDYGEGMNRARLKLIVTMGGTDKSGDPSKIGQFGIGFAQVFNPKLGTKRVRVITKCEGHTVDMLFTVHEPEKRPAVTTRILDKEIAFSTKVEVEFDNTNSPSRCLRHAERALEYYPCKVKVNGKPFYSMWEDARQSGYEMFQEGQCDGFLRPATWSSEVALLRRYEHIMDVDLRGLITGGRGVKYDLRDFHNRAFPYVPDVATTVNCNNLNVTIGRDGFWLDSPYHSMIRILGHQMLLYLGQSLKADDTQLVIGNQYILSKKISEYLSHEKHDDTDQKKKDEDAVLEKLVSAQVYRLNGRRKRYSLAEICEMRNKELPVFFSPNRTNLRWLGGDFKHDFVILPPGCELGRGAPNLYDDLFKQVFNDVVNLDKITEDRDKIRDLVERGIIDKNALTPTCRFVAQRKLTEKEAGALNEIDALLAQKAVRNAIASHLDLPVKKVRSVFFDVEGQKGTIATGLFDETATPLSEPCYSNFDSDDDDRRAENIIGVDRIVLGLRRDHPLIQRLIDSDDVHRAYFTLSFLAHELAHCQKLLVPYSPFYHLVKERLAADMRRALITNLIGSVRAT